MLIQTYRAVPCRAVQRSITLVVPSTDSVVSFVKLRVVVGRNRTWSDLPHIVLRRPMLFHTYHAVALRSNSQSGMVRARQGHGMLCVN